VSAEVPICSEIETDCGRLYRTGVAADYELDGVQGVCVPDGDDGAGSSAGVQRWRGTDNVRGPAVRGKQAGGE